MNTTLEPATSGRTVQPAFIAGNTIDQVERQLAFLNELKSRSTCGFPKGDDPASYSIQIRANTAGLRAATLNLANLVFCESANICVAHCSPLKRAGRAQIVSACVPNAWELGYMVWFITTTLSHPGGMPLDPMFKLLLDVRKRMRSTREFARWKQEYGVDFFDRVFEITDGVENGYHLHCHELMYLRYECSGNEEPYRIKYFGKETGEVALGVGWQYTDMFVGAANRLGNKAQGGRPFQDARLVTNAEELGPYLAKLSDGNNWGIEQELMRGDLKQSRHGRLTYSGHIKNIAGLLPFESEFSQEHSQVRASEIQVATHGRHMFHATPGMYAAFGLGEKLAEALEATEILSTEDLRVAEFDTVTRSIPLLDIRPNTWRRILLTPKLNEMRKLVCRKTREQLVELGEWQEGKRKIMTTDLFGKERVQEVKQWDTSEADKRLKEIADEFIREMGYVEFLAEREVGTLPQIIRDIEASEVVDLETWEAPLEEEF